MATRSTIALEFADGTIGQVYCHWDGYIEHNGKILFKHYSDPFKLRELIDLGNLSSLAEDIGEKHNFNDNVKGQCTFYGRDRGENEVEALYYTDFDTYSLEGNFEEYNYILRRDGVWYVKEDGSKFILLSKAIFSYSE